MARTYLAVGAIVAMTFAAPQAFAQKIPNLKSAIGNPKSGSLGIADCRFVIGDWVAGDQSPDEKAATSRRTPQGRSSRLKRPD